MVQPKRAFNKQRVNLEPEVTYGTPPAVIDTRLNGIKLVPTKAGESDLFMPGGSSLPTVATRIDDYTTLALSGDLTFQDQLYIWGSILGAPVTTNPGTLAFRHVFRWNGFDIVEPITYSVVYGDVNSAVLVPGVVFNSFGFTAGRGSVSEVSGAAFGKAQQTNQVIYPRQAVYTLTITASGGNYKITWAGQETANIAFGANAATILAALVALSNVAAGDLTVTGSGPFTVAATSTGAFAGTAVTATIDATGLTGGTGTLVSAQAGGPVVAVPAKGVSPLLWDIWVDDTDWGDLGTSQQLGVLEFQIGVGERHVRVLPMVSDQSADSIAEGETQTHTIRLKYLYDAVAESRFDNLDDGDMLWVRMKNQAPANSIESGHQHACQYDFAILLTEVGEPESFGGGAMAIDVSGQLAADTTADEAITVTLDIDVADVI